MKRLTWLVGPPGAGKSTFALRQKEWPRVVELTRMIGPLVDSLRIRRGVLTANAHLIEAIRAVEHHVENAALPDLLVVAGLVPPESLFPLRDREEVLLMLPDRERWLLQLTRRMAAGAPDQYDDVAYASLWYDRFVLWPVLHPVRRVEFVFDRELLGEVPA